MREFLSSDLPDEGLAAGMTLVLKEKLPGGWWSITVGGTTKIVQIVEPYAPDLEGSGRNEEKKRDTRKHGLREKLNIHKKETS